MPTSGGPMRLKRPATDRNGMHPSSEALAWHREELLSAAANTLVEVQRNPRGAKGHPSYFATYLFFHLKGLAMPPQVDWSAGANQAIRRLHNFYGWKAWDHADKRGACSGTLYRTAGFMQLDVGERCGKKDRSRNIHLEHTVPSAVLELALTAKLAEDGSVLETPRTLHEL